MPFNGNGTFVLPGPPLEPGEIVSADEHNELRDDMAAGFTDCVTRDGQSPAVANLPMGTYKHTNVGASNSLTNYARTDQVQNNSFNWLTSVSGSNTITASSAVAPAAYAAGQRFAFIPSAVNTDPVTININSLGAKSIKINGSDNLYAGFLNPGTVYTIVYDGTAFQVALANNSGVFYVERFSGDGSETEFTLTRSAINKNYLLVYIYGVYQQKDTYSFSGTTLTFDTAPPLGTDNIEVVISSTLAIGETDASAVSYTLPVTGAVTTNVEAKLAQTVSVKDFGAVGDGVTDDTTAIQAALTAASTNNSDCYLPNGTYVITNITLDGVRLFGSGKLFWSSASPADEMMITLEDNSKLNGISIDANLAGNYPAKTDPRTESVIYINGDNCQVTNIFMTGAPTCCIWGGLATKYALIENNTFRNTPFSGDGILCRGSYWRIANNLFLGVLGYTMRVGLFGGDGVGECANNVLTGNVVYGSNAGPLHVELYATGTVFDSNVSRYTASAVKIQYQPGEPVYNTIVTNNVFMDSLYPGTWNDTTETWTPDTSGGQWGVSGIGGFGTIISNNTWINVTGISLYNRASVFTGNRIIGAGDNAVSILRVQPENTGCVISGNTIEAASGYNPTFLWLGAENIKVTNNRFVSNSTITDLVGVYADNCQIKDNVFEEGSGKFIVASIRKNTTITGNTFKNTTTPLAQVSTISTGTIIQDNIGLDSVPNLVPTLTISAGSTTLDIPRQGKYRVGTSANGVSENLATITGGQPGQIILLTRNNSLQNVTLVTGGNIQLAGGISYLLTAEHIGLIWNGGAWNELFRD